MTAFSDDEIRRADYWLRSIGQDWRGEVPMKMHEKGVYGLGSAPPFSGPFIGYVGYIECKQPDCQRCRDHRDRQKRYGRPRSTDEGRLRATKAFNKLRRMSPIEFDSLYMHCILGYDIEEIARRHTARAIRNGKPERYTPGGVRLLVHLGIDKVVQWW